ncbi:MAG: phosphoesterase, partial [Alistipes sp.]|nr:phosphoesterase [Alistipes sp.]
STYTEGDEILIRKLAKENGLLISGGSDFHGTNKPHIRLGVGKGNLKVPYEVLENLKKRL